MHRALRPAVVAAASVTRYECYPLRGSPVRRSCGPPLVARETNVQASALRIPSSPLPVVRKHRPGISLESVPVPSTLCGPQLDSQGFVARLVVGRAPFAILPVVGAISRSYLLSVRSVSRTCLRIQRIAACVPSLLRFGGRPLSMARLVAMLLPVPTVRRSSLLTETLHRVRVRAQCGALAAIARSVARANLLALLLWELRDQLEGPPGHRPFDRTGDLSVSRGPVE